MLLSLADLLSRKFKKVLKLFNPFFRFITIDIFRDTIKETSKENKIIELIKLLIYIVLFKIKVKTL